MCWTHCAVAAAATRCCWRQRRRFTRNAAYEPMPQVRALLQHGGAQAGELNACADPTAVAASATDAERHSEWAQAQETVQSEVEQKLRQLEALREPEVVQKQLKLAQGRTLHVELVQCSCNISWAMPCTSVHWWRRPTWWRAMPCTAVRWWRRRTWWRAMPCTAVRWWRRPTWWLYLGARGHLRTVARAAHRREGCRCLWSLTA